MDGARIRFPQELFWAASFGFGLGKLILAMFVDFGNVRWFHDGVSHTSQNQSAYPAHWHRN
jgi:hypothetical protein